MPGELIRTIVRNEIIGRSSSYVRVGETNHFQASAILGGHILSETRDKNWAQCYIDCSSNLPASCHPIH